MAQSRQGYFDRIWVKTELRVGKIICSAVSTSRAIDIQITPTTADRMLYMDINYGLNNKEAAYIICTSAKTSGASSAIRARGQANAAGSSTAEIRGVHAQGIAVDALHAGTVNALYAEAIAKGTSTVVTLRGAMIVADSEGTPTAIGTMYGAHIRVKTSVAPGTAFVGCVIESEKFGAGVTMDSFVQLKTTTWGAASTVANAFFDLQSVTGKGTYLFKLNDDDDVASKDEAGTSATKAGWIKVYVGDTAGYIFLYDGAT